MEIGDIDVAVLAGGFGTRLSGVLPNRPKFLAPVRDKPFAGHMLDWMKAQGLKRLWLCLGHRAEDILAFLETYPAADLEIRTIIEPEPLGTAGAVAYAVPKLSSDPVLVMNGDTVIETCLTSFLTAHLASGAQVSMVCTRVEDTGRYGRVEIDSNDRVVRFSEKHPGAGAGWINAGAYLFSRPVLDHIAGLRKGSLERDVLERMPARSIHAYRAAGRFLDIGTPEDLAIAPEILTA